MRVGIGISEYFLLSRWLRGKYPRNFLKLLARFGVLGWEDSLHIWENMELAWNAKKTKKFTISASFTYCTKRENLEYRDTIVYTAAAAETEMGRDVGESRVFGSLAKKPADHTTDQQKEKVRTKWNTSPGKGLPLFCHYLPLETLYW